MGDVEKAKAILTNHGFTIGKTQISFEVKLVEKKTLARFEGKAKRVIDNRKP